MPGWLSDCPAFTVCLLFKSSTKIIRQLVLSQFVSLSLLFTHFLHNADVIVDIVRCRCMVTSGHLGYFSSCSPSVKKLGFFFWLGEAHICPLCVFVSWVARLFTVSTDAQLTTIKRDYNTILNQLATWSPLTAIQLQVAPISSSVFSEKDAMKTDNN